jgi:organic hydroperoxide reductase OsmC/OhrA
VGVMERNEDGRLAMTQVTLRPHVRFAKDDRPDDDAVSEMHEEAHLECFIANSVRSQLVTLGTFEIAG